MVPRCAGQERGGQRDSGGAGGQNRGEGSVLGNLGDLIGGNN